MSVAEKVWKPLGVRVTPQEHRVIVEGAKREHRSVASFVRAAALRAASVNVTAPELSAAKPKRSLEEVKGIIAAAREEYQARHPGRDPVAELIAERRKAALRGD